MNAITNLKPQPLELRRRVEIAAYVALIDHTLRQAHELLPGRAAQKLAFDLDGSGIAHLMVDAERSTLSMFGVTVSSSGELNGLLRNWQAAPRERLAQG